MRRDRTLGSEWSVCHDTTVTVVRLNHDPTTFSICPSRTKTEEFLLQFRRLRPAARSIVRHVNQSFRTNHRKHFGIAKEGIFTAMRPHSGCLDLYFQSLPASCFKLLVDNASVAAPPNRNIVFISSSELKASRRRSSEWNTSDASYRDKAPRLPFHVRDKYDSPRMPVRKASISLDSPPGMTPLDLKCRNDRPQNKSSTTSCHSIPGRAVAA